MNLQTPAKLVLALLGSAVLALIVAIVLAAIAISGVQSMRAAITFLWMAFAMYAIALAAMAIIYCPNAPGTKSALTTMLIIAAIAGGFWGRVELSDWLNREKALQLAVEQIPPPPAPKPPPVPTESSTTAAHGEVKTTIKQFGNGNMANPGVVAAPVKIEPCGVFQNGGSNNTASPTCAPPQRTLTEKEHSDLVSSLRKSCSFRVAVRPITGNEESMVYAEQIVKTLKEAGCTPERAKFLIDTAPSYGVALVIHDLKDIPPGADALAGAFEASKIPWTRQTTEIIESGIVYVMVGLNDSKLK
jgi:hypothetical protein